MRNRNAEICTNFVQGNVHPGSHVMTDSWRGYRRLSEMGLGHSQISHRENFVDPNDPEIRIQTIERLWRSYKKKCRYINSFERLEVETRRFVFDYNMINRTAEDKFDSLILLNRS